MRTVVFAPTLAAARRAGRGFPDFLPASPRKDLALDRALKNGLPVRFSAPKSELAFWKLVRRRYWLQDVPTLLRGAIGGIARRADREEPVGERRSEIGGPWEALWIEGKLSDSRAAALLRKPPGVRLWVIEDFRKLALTDSLLDRLERSGIRVAALRPLRASVLRSQ